MIMARRADPKFEVGQLVRHVRYGYRGVVVDVDLECQADEEWYQRNNTQPRRDQPWYHVLVHAVGHATYPAESSLEADSSGEQIIHPHLTRFFDGFEDGKYVRNDNPWPQL